MKPAILFISYYYDPLILAGTRNYYLSNMLAEQGYDLHIISRENSQIYSFIEPKPIHFYPVKRWDYRKIVKLFGFSDGITSSLIKSPKIISWGHKLALTYPFNYLLGEGGWLYHWKALKMSHEIIQKNHIKIIYSSFMPVNDHLIANKLKEKNKNLYWIGDFRDLIWWETENLNYQRKWIRNMNRSMNNMIAVTDGIGNFYKKVFSRNIITVYNGLPFEKLKIPTNPSLKNKFKINYSGRIFIEFIKNNSFFEALGELLDESRELKEDLLLIYSGVNKNWYADKVNHYGLSSYSLLKDQINAKEAWNDMVNANINLIFTWTTQEIQGFIHGKFNECVMIGSPLLCLVDGDMDEELQNIYKHIPNSKIIKNDSSAKLEMKSYILDVYYTWKKDKPTYSIHNDIFEMYAWSNKARPLLEIVQNL